MTSAAMPSASKLLKINRAADRVQDAIAALQQAWSADEDAVLMTAEIKELTTAVDVLKAIVGSLHPAPAIADDPISF